MSVSRRTVLSAGLVGVVQALIPPLACADGIGDKEIVLGSHLDFSGATAIVGPPMRNGMQMRIDEANEAGGVQGRKLRLIIEDNAAQPSQAVRAVDKLIKKDGVFAILCPFGSGANVSTVKRVVDSGVICFAPYAASALVRKAAGPSPLLFTTNLGYDSTTAAGVKWALAKLGSKRVGFIYQEGPYGDLVEKGLTVALTSKGMAVVASASYKIGDIDFSSQVARMKSAGADLIVCATATRETIAVSSEVKKLDWKNVSVLTAISGRIEKTASVGKDAVSGLYGIGGWRIPVSDEQSGESKKWSDGYRKRFNAEPDDLAQLFYDYTSWFLQGLQVTGRDLTTEKAVKALQVSSFKGASSYEVQHFRNNHIDPEWMMIEQVSQGQWVSRSDPIDPAKMV
ncbi:ABC transporter substrate-binding protein [Caballeronia sp. 15715]|uniref:ABC transporter substrate-binding protein n=1 Tax=Caballeronia sp. 15715 TaxID=3391030 RepID=UPI0039E5A2B4